MTAEASRDTQPTRHIEQCITCNGSGRLIVDAPYTYPAPGPSLSTEPRGTSHLYTTRASYDAMKAKLEARIAELEALLREEDYTFEGRAKVRAALSALPTERATDLCEGCEEWKLINREARIAELESALPTEAPRVEDRTHKLRIEIAVIAYVEHPDYVEQVLKEIGAVQYVTNVEQQLSRWEPKSVAATPRHRDPEVK